MRWWFGFFVLGACAQAGKSDQKVSADAAVKLDAAPGADASKQLDAPSSSGVCTSTATCVAATDLGSVSGDTGADTVMATGYQAAWYKVRVTEDDSGPFGTKLQVTARLTSPASENYDLFIYLNTGNDVVECTTPNGTATSSGMTDTISVKWGEGTFSNGNDDSRTASIEIRPIGTTCSAAAPWQLVVNGD